MSCVCCVSHRGVFVFFFGLWRALALRCLQDGPTLLQDSLRWPQDGPNMAPRWLKMASSWPEMPQRRPKLAPRWCQYGPRWSKILPRRFQDGFKMTSFTDASHLQKMLNKSYKAALNLLLRVRLAGDLACAVLAHVPAISCLAHFCSALCCP